MFSEEEIRRYSRQITLPEFGPEGQRRLKQASVLVVGAGGLGCPALLYLTAAGLGHIGIIDGDLVEESNLHRQILFTPADAGKNKAEVAAIRLRQLNPFVGIQAYPFFLSRENAGGIIDGFDLLIDGSDRFSTRYLINDACVRYGKPFVYAALHKFELQLSVFNYAGGPTYRCLFPDPPREGEMPSCAETGIIGALPGLAGTMQALEAIKLISGCGEISSGKLLRVNCLTNEWQSLRIPVNPANKIPAAAAFDASTTSATCGAPQVVHSGASAEAESSGPGDADGQGSFSVISLGELLDLLEKGKVQLVDVRSKAEYEEFRFGREEMHIPLDQLGEHFHRLEPEVPVVFLCQSGSRSQAAARLLAAVRRDLAIYSLKEGLNSLRMQ